MNIADWIGKWSLLSPRHIVLIDENTPITYNELNTRINRLSNFLLKIGLKKGDRVAVLLNNSHEFLEVFFAVSKIGAIFVPLNLRMSAPEIEYVINDCSAETLFLDPKFSKIILSLKSALPILKGRFICTGQEFPHFAKPYEKIFEESPSYEPVLTQKTSMDSPHMIMYTSGTTGLAKGAVMSHGKTFFNILNANIYYNITPRDKIIVSRPLFHSGGLLVDTLPFLYKGGTAIIKRRFSPEDLLNSVQKYKATVLETSATMFRFILEQCHLEDYDLSGVRCLFTGGERVPIKLLQSFRDRGIIISQIFGQTEASTITWLPTDLAEQKMGSVGIPVFHGEVKIVDRGGYEVATGESGEIVVSGPILMSGYWGMPELTAETIKNGWLHTGDLAKRDEEGFYYILDREKNLFISGGENVYPAEVERVLLENPKIFSVAVIGVPDPKWGEAGKAFIVPKKNEELTQEEVIRFCLGKMAKFKIPKYVRFIDRLPENAAGKIMRHLLKDME